MRLWIKSRSDCFSSVVYRLATPIQWMPERKPFLDIISFVYIIPQFANLSRDYKKNKGISALKHSLCISMAAGSLHPVFFHGNPVHIILLVSRLLPLDIHTDNRYNQCAEGYNGIHCFSFPRTAKRNHYTISFKTCQSPVFPLAIAHTMRYNNVKSSGNGCFL